DLGLTDWNRRNVYDNLRRRFDQAPFTGQSSNSERMKAWKQRVESLRVKLSTEPAEPARNIYQRAIQRWPDDFRLHWNYADFLEATGDRSGAVTEWKAVQQLIPQHQVAPYQIGRLLAEQAQWPEAREWLLKALAIRPDLSEGWCELGRVQYATSQFDEAFESFDRARQLVPEEPRYHFELGKTLAKLLRKNESFAELRKAVRLDPASWEAHYVLGENLAFDNQLREARREFEETLRLNPGYAMAHLNLGVALVKEGALTEARAHFEQALLLDPKNTLAARALSQLSERHH
ncbi:MAG TPA: tetratricopeptide repeat protein, partial [Verrucomicrobiae bacterium]|nr:tetratricopeptide repeat protein [Verrucomicrobiae bacterium]